MDENLNNVDNHAGQPVVNSGTGSVSNPSPVQPQADAKPASNVVYASFVERFLAALIDGILVGVVSMVLGMFLGDSFAGNLGTLLSWIYFVIMTSNYGYTLGKKALGLRVQKMDTGENLTVVDALLREVVGKLLSSFVLLLGYFWMLWDPNKQTWHDKIAKSVVIKSK